MKRKEALDLGAGNRNHMQNSLYCFDFFIRFTFPWIVVQFANSKVIRWQAHSARI